MHLRTSDRSRAETLGKQLTDLDTKLYGAQHWYTGVASDFQARALEAAGRLSEAQLLLEAALAIEYTREFTAHTVLRRAGCDLDDDVVLPRIAVFYLCQVSGKQTPASRATPGRSDGEFRTGEVSASLTCFKECLPVPGGPQAPQTSQARAR
jgi:hypothetical protein